MRRPTALAERRSWRRRGRDDCRWLSQARLRHGLELRVLNLGQGGALVEAPARLLPGSRVEVHLAAPGWGWCAGARVLRCQVSALLPEQGVRYRAALEFERVMDPPGAP